MVAMSLANRSPGGSKATTQSLNDNVSGNQVCLPHKTCGVHIACSRLIVHFTVNELTTQGNPPAPTPRVVLPCYPPLLLNKCCCFNVFPTRVATQTCSQQVLPIHVPGTCFLHEFLNMLPKRPTHVCFPHVLRSHATHSSGG